LLLACLLARVLVRFRSSFSLVVVSVVVVVVALCRRALWGHSLRLLPGLPQSPCTPPPNTKK
jgi:hypothetical protein